MKSSFLEKALSRADKLTKEQMRNLFDELIQYNDRLEAALQSTFDGIVVCDLEHRPVMVNKSAERILRIQDQAEDLPLWDRIADEEIKDFLYRALRSEETILGKEFALQSSSGTRIVSLSLSALLSASGISGTLIHIEDITEKRKKETQLRRVESLAALYSRLLADSTGDPGFLSLLDVWSRLTRETALQYSSLNRNPELLLEVLAEACGASR